MRQEDVVIELKTYFDKTGRSPRYVDITRENGFKRNKDTMARAFGGSFVAALKAAGLPTVKQQRSQKVSVVCEMCSKSFTRTRLKVSLRKHVFCTPACWLEFKRAHAVKRVCKVCKKQLSTATKGDTCRTKKCMGKAYIDLWRQGLVRGDYGRGDVPRAIRDYLFVKFDGKCSRCGWNSVNPYTGSVPLTVEHIDGDSSNSSESNLDLICPNCHSLTATYGSLNRGKGRKLRRRSSNSMAECCAASANVAGSSPVYSSISGV